MFGFLPLFVIQNGIHKPNKAYFHEFCEKVENIARRENRAMYIRPMPEVAYLG